MKKRYFRLAKRVAIKGDDCRQFRLGAVGIRRDGTIVASRNIPNREPEPQAHAEARLTKKLDHGAIVYVVRVARSGKLTIARPCKSCRRAMKHRGVTKCYYSINENEYGVIRLNK
jgi:tRNA(Arg) A34 adenosine deaminase TadA